MNNDLSADEWLYDPGNPSQQPTKFLTIKVGFSIIN
jgi:hypothetical protein